MALNYEYAYAEIDPETNMCIGVFSASCECDNPNLVQISTYNEDYIFKYYIDGVWYEDDAGTIPYTPV